MADGNIPKDNISSIDPRWGMPRNEESAKSSEKLLKPYLVRNILSKERGEIIAGLEWNKYSELTIDLLLDGLWPTNVLTIGNKEFFVGAVIGSSSSVLEPFHPAYLVIFYKDPATKKLMPRLIYESLSDRSWRSTPGVYGTISKGTGIHYTQETKAHQNFSRYIEQCIANANVTHSPRGKAIDDRFTPGVRGQAQAEWYTFDKEISKYDDKGVLKQFQQYPPGYLTRAKFGENANLSEKFRGFDFSSPELKAFLPDFAKPPVETDRLPHAFMGEVELETYIARLNGRPIEWVMAYDKEGRVWIDRIAFLDNEVNSYGVNPEVIDSGCLTSKPFEYSDQASALKKGEFVEDSNANIGYFDITPLLDNLLPIQQFRKARSIVRK